MSDLPEPRRAKAVGYPLAYTQEKMEHVLKNVANGITITQSAKEIGVDRVTIYRWLATQPGLQQHLDAAREIGEDVIADECLRIADDVDEAPESRKVRVWTRLQLLARWNPKKWSERRTVELSDDITQRLEEARARVVSTQ